MNTLKTNGFLVVGSMHTVTRLCIVTFFLFLGGRLSATTLHGPIAQWHQDPTSSVTFLWIERQEQRAGIGGEAAVWKTGDAPFGYGEEGIVTPLEMRNAHTRAYFRRELLAPSAVSQEARLQLSIDYDDGFIVYINGKERARAAIASGSGAKATGIRSHESGKPEHFDLGLASELLVSPKTIIAIEGHNVNMGSSDFYMDPAVMLVTPGQEPQTLIAAGDTWQYFMGGDPDEGWKQTTVLPVAPPPEPTPAPASDKKEVNYAVALRARGGDGTWISARLDKRPFGKTGNVVHVAEAEGLAPNTLYEIRFTGGEFDTSPKALTFRTAPENLGTGVKYVTGGDMYHTRPLLDAMNMRCAEQDPLFALLGGDLAYANGRDDKRWYDFMDSWAALALAQGNRMIPMVVTIGNHEASSQGNPIHAPFYYSLFTMPTTQKSNYAIDFGDYMSIVLLDSGHTQSVQAQTPWLADALAARTKFPHLFVCYHRPAFGAGVKPNDRNIITHWAPLFEEHRIDAAFENDHHVYKRTKPLTREKHDPENGIMYIGDGSWGVRVRPIPKDKGVKLEYIERAESLNHLIEVELDGSHIHYRAMTADGQVFDKVSYPVRRQK